MFGEECVFDRACREENFADSVSIFARFFSSSSRLQHKTLDSTFTQVSTRFQKNTIHEQGGLEGGIFTIHEHLYYTFEDGNLTSQGFWAPRATYGVPYRAPDMT